jgi:CRISPR system Cascade subunit CasA
MAPHMPVLLHCLLDDALLGVENDAGMRESVTLPGLLARLCRNEPTELTALQAHQQHAWHAFTVQLAAIALTRARRPDVLPVDEGVWRDLLVGTSAKDGAGAEAFTLVVGDMSKAAFLQAPIPEGTISVLKHEHLRPSAELDVLITSKNHDVKVDGLEHPRVEHWIFSLVALQTMQGFLGAGNYGIARMNGGFASRPCVAYAAEQTSASRFLRDVRALLDARDGLVNGDRGFATKDGLGLVWCSPWDGKTTLNFARLDPFFIEICRRVRLDAPRPGVIVAHRGSSKAARIDGAAGTGNTGDAWTPVARKDARALTLSESGFTYERVQDLMFGDWAPAAAGQPNDADDRFWLGQVLVRGQGKTGGYHERWVPVPGKARSFFAKPDARARLGKRAQEWVGFAKVARLNILKPAVLHLLQGGPDKLKFDDPRADPFLAHLNQEIDAVFFPLLFEHGAADPEIASVAFANKLLDLAKKELELATTSIPMSTARRHRAIAFAFRSFFGAARNRQDFPRTDVPAASPPQEEDS